MFYYRIVFDCGYVGCEDEIYVRSAEPITYDNDFLWEEAVDAMAGYEYLAFSDFDEEAYETEEDMEAARQDIFDDFYNEIGYSVYELTPAEVAEIEEYEGTDIWEDR